MTTSKFSVSLPAELASFLEQYQKEHGGSRSEVIAKGLTKLREAELEKAYRAHTEEWQNDPDRDFWDAAAIDDGLDANESPW
jgi:Arc/MetJ-type ribon-helix-helix transcriptional regulator